MKSNIIPNDNLTMNLEKEGSVKRRYTWRDSEGFDVKGYLKGHPLFKDIEDEDFLSDLSHETNTRIFDHGDFLFRKGDIGKAMILILKGEVDILDSDDEMVLNRMRTGSFFGELSLLFNLRRTASCRANGRCHVVIFHQESLKKLMFKYPKIADIISLLAKERHDMYIKQMKENVTPEFNEEIKMAVTKDDLREIPVFSSAKKEFLHLLLLALQPVTFRDGQDIFLKGDVSNCMYFIVDGSVAMYDDRNNPHFAECGAGSFFGEVGLIFNAPRTATVKCISSRLTTFRLSKENWTELKTKFPDIEIKIKEEAVQRLKYDEIRKQANLTSLQERYTDVDVVRNQLKAISLFRSVETSILHQLALKSRVSKFSPNELIVHRGDEGKSLFFIVDGEAEIISSDGQTIFDTVGSGTFFGEVALFFDIKRTADVRSKNVTTVFELDKSSLQSVLNQYPLVSRILLDKANENFQLHKKRELNVSLVLEPTTQNGFNAEALGIEATASRFRRNPLFKHCQNSFLRSLAAMSSIKVFQQGEYIVRRGEVADNTYIIITGTCEVLDKVNDEEEMVVATLTDNDYFGEVGLLFNTVRTAHIKASSSICSLLILNRDALKKVLTEYPEGNQAIWWESKIRFEKANTRATGQSHNIKKSSEIELVSHHPPLPFKTLDTQDIISLIHTTLPISVPKFETKYPFLDVSNNNIPIRNTTSKPKSRLSEGYIKKSNKVNTSKFSVRRSSDPAAKSWSLKNILSNILIKPVEPKEKSSRRVKITRQQIPAISSLASLSSNSLSEDISYLVVNGVIGLNYLDLDNDRKIETLKPANNVRLSLGKGGQIQLETILTVALMAGPHLTTLSLATYWKIKDSDLAIVMTTCTNIEKLDLSNCYNITDEGLSHVLQKGSHLTSLNISFLSQILGTCFSSHNLKSLTYFNMTHCKHIDDKALEQFLIHIEKLQSLHLRRCKGITELGIFFIAQNCRFLQTLDVADCSHIQFDKCLKYLASSCRELTGLNMSFCTRTSKTGFYDLSLGQQNFKSLNLSYCLQITDSIIRHFTLSIGGLQYLSLRGCSKITDATALHLAMMSPDLTEVDVSCCNQITTLAIETLQKSNPSVKVTHSISPSSHGIIVPVSLSKPKAVEVPVEEIFLSFGRPRKSTKIQ